MVKRVNKEEHIISIFTDEFKMNCGVEAAVCCKDLYISLTIRLPNSASIF